MTQAKNIIILIGSPRGKKSTSTSIANYLQTRLKARNVEIKMYWLIHPMQDEQKIGEMLESIENADIIVLTVPLYIDSEPYLTIQALELISKRRKEVKQNDIQFIVIVNSGFPEPAHNNTAILIYKKFASTVNFNWVGSLSIGSGEALLGSKGVLLEECGKMAEKVRFHLDKIAVALKKGERYSDEIVCMIPTFFFKWYAKWLGRIMLLIGNRIWKNRVKKLGKKVDAQPCFP